MGLTPNADLQLNNPKRMAAFKIALATQEGAPRMVASARGGGAPASVNGVPFTPEQLMAEPYLASEHVAQLAADGKHRQQTLGVLLPAIEGAQKNGTIQSRDTIDYAVQLADGSDDPKTAAKLDEIIARDEALRLVAGDPDAVAAAGGAEGEGGMAILERRRAEALGRPDLHQQMVAKTQGETIDQLRKSFKETPFEAANNLLKTEVPQPFDFNKPDAIVAGLAQRGRIMRRIIGAEPGVTPSVISPGERDIVNQAIAMGPAPVGQAFLGTISKLPEPLRSATLADPGIQKAVRAMAVSGDPQKMGAAYSFLDGEYRSNPMAFQVQWKADTVKDLVFWQEHLSFQNPEQMAKTLEQRADIGAADKRDRLRARAEAGISKITVEEVAGKLVGTARKWNPFGEDYLPTGDEPGLVRQSLVDDYRTAYGDYAVRQGTTEGADAYAAKQLVTKWTVSPANAGRLTAWAPETFPGYGEYFKQAGVTPPPDWIEQQARGDVLEAILQRTADPEVRNRMREAPYALSPDAKTEAAFAQGRVPSYGIVIQDERGFFRALEDRDGRPARFTADPRRLTGG
jgi:hypothetical protein